MRYILELLQFYPQGQRPPWSPQCLDCFQLKVVHMTKRHVLGQPVLDPHRHIMATNQGSFGSPGASVAPAAGGRLPVGSARVRPPGGLRSTLQGEGSGKRLWARLGPGRPRDSRTAQTRASSSSGARPENPESRCGSAPDGAGVGLLACPAGPGVTHLPVGNCFPPEQASGPRLGWPGTRGLPRAGPGCGRRRGPARTSAWQRAGCFWGMPGVPTSSQNQEE